MKNQLNIFTSAGALLLQCVASQCLTKCAQNALGFAYEYGFPLYTYGVTARRSGNVTTNTIYHQRTLSTPAITGVVRPNADTPYSTMFVDISENDLEINIPDSGDRYWVWPLYDAYANDVANIGSITNSTPGKYLIRYDQTNIGVQTENVKGGYKGYLNLPTPYGIVIVRILLKSTPGDIDTLHALQDQLNVSVVSRFSEPLAPSLDLSFYNDTRFIPTANNSLGQAVLALTAAIAPFNQPEVVQDRAWVAGQLENAGIDAEDRTWQQPSNTNITAAIASANASITALTTQPGFMLNFDNGWTSAASQIQGNFNSYYQARYSTAQFGYLALTQEQVVYPSYSNLPTIGPNQAVLFHFSAKPKVTGFWSLTAYNEAQYLIANRLNRYAIGDRSNITFPDGTLVYGSSGADGAFDVLVQPNDVVPPQNWTSNWLPAPDGGGSISVTLRWYGPEDAMTNGSYVYPTVTLVDAIRT